MRRLSEKSKRAKGYKYYKDRVETFTVNIDSTFFAGGPSTVSEYRKNKVNYDLFNNKLDLKELAYVCKPFGADGGNLPATMSNKDISSGKIKVFLGMESKKPFFFNVVAVNPEATTRKEQKEAEYIRQFVVNKIVEPIRLQIEEQHMREVQGQELNEEQKQQIQQKIQQELEAKTPDEVRKYMQREHQDPAEVLNQHVLNYQIQNLELHTKFQDGLKHLALAAKEVYFVGILNKQPVTWVINAQNFRCSLSERSPFIEDAEAAACDYYMSITDIQQFFGDELSDSDMNKLYKRMNTDKIDEQQNWFNNEAYETRRGLFKVTHHVWRDLRDMQILHYFTEDGEIKKKFVESDYELDEDFGDVSIEKIWVPNVYETWVIDGDIYAKMGPVSNQIKDIDNPNIAKLPYFGAVCDNMNSEPTSLMDRLAPLQYYFNIIMFRLELLIGSDKGKKILANIKSVPDDKKMSLEKWHYIFESSPFMYYNSDQEGSNQGDVNTNFKLLDLSMASDIAKYVDLLAFIKDLAGESIGIPKQIEGQIGPDEAVNNVKQSVVQNLHILEPYYKLHNHVKRNVLEAVLEMTKICWQKTKPEKLSYILDDMSIVWFDVDLELLRNNTVGLFISDTTKTEEIKDTIRQLTHAAMQNQRAELSDVLSVLRDESLTTIEETLKVAEEQRRQEEQQAQDRKAQQDKEILKIQDDNAQKEHEREKELIILKEEERRKTEVAKSALVGASFNPDVDNDNDGVNDYVEIAENASKMELQKEELRLKEKEIELKDQREKEKIEAMKNKQVNK